MIGRVVQMGIGEGDDVREHGREASWQRVGVWTETAQVGLVGVGARVAARSVTTSDRGRSWTAGGGGTQCGPDLVGVEVESRGRPERIVPR
jgi:hypothetical protein